jgi:CDP-glycerol glycerophosphotransferase (TagB/SpsB family)
VFASHYRHLKPLYVPYGTKIVIGLQHGVTALKKGYYLQNPHPLYKRPYDYVVASSEFQKPIVAENMRIEPNRIWVTGYPRLDDLWRPDDHFLSVVPEIKGKKVILYAPTFQDRAPVVLFPFPDFNPDELKAKLREGDAVMLIKFHPNTGEQLQIVKKNLRHILSPDLICLMTSVQIQDLNRILQYIDLLITDYSSIFFDYLFFNKPVIFLPGDLASFRKKRGFIIEYMENTPGPKISQFNSFLDTMETCLKHPETDENRRIAIREKFFKYDTAGNCDRVWDHFIRLRGKV